MIQIFYQLNQKATQSTKYICQDHFYLECYLNMQFCIQFGDGKHCTGLGCWVTELCPPLPVWSYCRESSQWYSHCSLTGIWFQWRDVLKCNINLLSNQWDKSHDHLHSLATCLLPKNYFGFGRDVCFGKCLYFFHLKWLKCDPFSLKINLFICLTKCLPADQPI